MIDNADKEKRMALVRRIAIGLADESDDPILADTSILTRTTYQGNPQTEEELDSSNPVAVRSDGARFYPHVRMDGRGQLLVKWPNGLEETMKFWIPDAYLDGDSDTQVADQPKNVPSANIAKGSELEQTIGRIRAADPNYPLTVADIPTFPFSTFEEMRIAVRTGRFAIARFSFHQDLMILGLVAPGAKVAYLLSMLATYLVPLICVALAFAVSGWFWLGLLYFFIGVRVTTSIWRTAIVSAAMQSELAFCFLFYTSKINAYDLTVSREYEWQQIKKQG